MQESTARRAKNKGAAARPDLVLVLDNIRSLYNVGSMFRTSDGFGVGKVFLCGITGTPDQHGVQKVALGAEKAVAWEHVGRTWPLLERLKRQGYTLVGLEKCRGAAPLPSFRPRYPLALVVGNEITGLTPKLRRRLDRLVAIPMSGIKHSFNVAVACGIALYQIRSK
jgi:23S rRNA (guanosine2251-2'-O)-methyltransferase